MGAPSAVWFDGTRLFVADSGFNRVLIWNGFPSTNGQPADVVLGQPDFTSGGSGLSPTAFNSPRGVNSNGEALFVSDLANDRVLVFAPIPTSNGAAATFVLGQPNLDEGANNPAPSASTLDVPRQVFVTDTHLWVTDEAHRRLLRFTLYPEAP
jgi:hypothetical protein